MSSPEPSQSTGPVGVDLSDLSNYESFMESLVSFMNESAQVVLQVKKKVGVSAECLSPVRMTDEDKQQRMKDVIMNLSQQYQAEALSANSTGISAYQTALDSTFYQTAHDTAFSIPAEEEECPCPPEGLSFRHSRRGGKGRRKITTRIGRVETPNSSFIPLGHSSMNSPGPPLRSLPTSRIGRLGSSRSKGSSAISPYSEMIDSGGLPYAYQSGTPLFADISSSGRNLDSYSNMSSSYGYGGECPPECSTGSVNSTGRQQYVKRKGQQSNWDWKQENRTC